MIRKVICKLNKVIIISLCISMLMGNVAWAMSPSGDASSDITDTWELAGIMAIKNKQTQFGQVKASLVINTPEEFVEFSKKCHLDTYSKELSVVLNSDISLKGQKCASIPIFSGTFYGNGHTISDIDYKNNDVNGGFFGIITEEAVIQDLNLEGKIEPSGVSVAVGGIASQNNGLIRRCTFNGHIINDNFNKEINAAQATGGLVGINGKTGVVMDCAMTGVVQGLKSTGGLVGENQGDVASSYSDASVNIHVKDKTIGIKDFKIKGVDDIKDLIGFKKLYASEDIGGIAGVSSGNILNCVNTGKVGNSRNGYNVGGIAGKSTGFIYVCQNIGEINGNSNVGGITGLAEPGVILGYSDEVLGNVQADIDDVFGTVDTTLANINTNVDGVSQSLSDTLTTVNEALATAKDLENILTEVVNTKITEVDGALGSANSILNGANQMLTAVHEVTLGLEEVSKDAGGLTSNINSGLDHLKSAGNGLSGTLGKALIDPPFVWKNRGPEDPSLTEDLKILVNNTSGDLDGMKVVLCKNGKEIDSKPITTDHTEQPVSFLHLSVYSGNVINSYSIKIKDASDVEQSGFDIRMSLEDYDAYVYPHASSGFTGSTNVTGTIKWNNLSPQDMGHIPSKVVVYIFSEYTVPQYRVVTADGSWNYTFTGLPTTYTDTSGSHDIEYWIYETCYDDDTSQNPLSNFSRFIDKDSSGYVITNSYPNESSSFEVNPDEVSNLVTGVMDSVKDVSSTMGDFITAGTYLNTITKDLQDTMSRLNGVGIPKLETIPEFSTISPELNKKMNLLTEDISKIVTGVDGINKSLNTTQKDLTNDLRTLTSQANSMTDNIFDAVSNLQLSLGTILSDTSEDFDINSEDAFSYGVIFDCINNGHVYADNSAGGIVGSMNLAEVPDIEMLSKEKTGISLPQIAYKALIRGCENHGVVAADNDYVGLICGKQQLGAIVDCEAYGSALSVDGWYVGGIAGYGHGIIKECAVSGNLGGEYYVGGIVGLGAEKELIYPESKIADNYSMISISKVNQFKGAIAGDSIGSFENNYFYSEELNGINDYSVEGAFEPAGKNTIKEKLTYDEKYGALYTLKFIAGDEVVKEVIFQSGESFGNDIHPLVPEKPLMIGFWESKRLSNLQNNVEVKAYYIINPLILIGAIILLTLLILYGCKKKKTSPAKVVKKVKKKIKKQKKKQETKKENSLDKTGQTS